jgi:hypothetical protein
MYEPASPFEKMRRITEGLSYAAKFGSAPEWRIIFFRETFRLNVRVSVGS